MIRLSFDWLDSCLVLVAWGRSRVAEVACV